MNKYLQVLCIATLAIISPLNGMAVERNGDVPLRAALFIQNRAGAEFTDKLDVMNDLLTARLIEKGFSVIDKSAVAARFRETRTLEPALQQEINALENTNRAGEIENSLSGASALRIAQMIGADYLVMASLTSFGSETRIFKGEGTYFGSNNKSSIYTLRITAKVLEGGQGGAIYGDTVAVSERVAVVENMSMVSSEVINKLFDIGTRNVAENISNKVQNIRDVKVTAAAVVEFSVASNVEGASVELDGAAIGSTPGRFVAAPGLHELRISKQWLSPWDRTVNIFANQELTVTLELSPEGLKRYSTLEQLKLDLAGTKMRNEAEGKEREAAVEIDKQQSEADTYATKTRADGEKKKHEESEERIEGAPEPSTVISK